MPSGNITTDGTEQTVFTGEPINATGEVEGSVDLSNMTSSETVIVRVYKAVDGTNYRVVEKSEFSGSQSQSGITIGFIGGDPTEAPVQLTVEETSANGIGIPYEYQRIY